MRVVALISGGKDSCYNMMKCVAAGHEIVALANLQPEKQDELDSFMFQTVGHEGVSLIAEAMGIPLYRTFTRGESLTRDLNYSPTSGDEVEDLYELVVRVCEECEGVEGVSSGAVLSDYQRLRVENVCSRLGLVSLSYLWRRDQSELLQEMVDNGVRAIVIKVASMGLYPNKHLGRTLEEMYSHLCKLNDEYGVNVCGEGGEYETFTVDCPLFKKQIKLVESEVIVSSPDLFAPVGYLKLKQLKLEQKEVIAPLPTRLSDKKYLVPPAQPELSLSRERQSQCVQNGPYMWLAFDGDPAVSTASAQTTFLFKEVWSCLQAGGCGWSDVVLVYLYLSDMTDYPSVNTVYRQYFNREPPARVCVSTSLPEGLLVRVEMMVCEGVEGGGRSSMHVQSHSEWAPANIGPYSQAYTVSDVVYGAGQIGLQPSVMTLVTPLEQSPLSLTHVQSVLVSCDSHLTSALCGVCYYTNKEAGWSAKQIWTKATTDLCVSKDCPMVFLPVMSLPRGACVEWHFVALRTHLDIRYSRYAFNDDGFGACTILEAINDEKKVGCWSLTTTTHGEKNNLKDILSSILLHLVSALTKYQLTLSHMSFVRVCVPKFGLSGINHRDFVDVCKSVCDGDTPLSVLVTQGYHGHDGTLAVQACKFHC